MEKSLIALLYHLNSLSANFFSVFFEKGKTTQILNNKKSTGENPKPSIMAEIKMQYSIISVTVWSCFSLQMYFIPTYEEKKIQKTSGHVSVVGVSED